MTVLPRAITTGEFTKLRSDNQASRVYLTVHNPAQVYTARLAAVPSSTDSVVSITYNTGAGVGGHTYTDILANMTLMVGSTAGGFDYGMCRIRNTTGIGATSGTFNLGETSEVNWNSGAYLTVLDEFLLWRRDPRVQPDGTVYMDYDIAYSDQHAKCQSIVVMGPPAVKWLMGSTVSVRFDASQSWAVNNTITAYSWAAPGSSASSGMATATPTITYNALGTYRVACTITNSDGLTSTGYRYVFVISEASQPPDLITAFDLDTLQGDYQAGGWNAQITLLAQADLTTIRDRSLAILHTRDWYGPRNSDEGSLGYVDDRENIALVGWVALEADRMAPEDKYSTTTLTIQGPQWWLNKMTAFPAGLKDKTIAANKWTRFNVLTALATTWHVLNWRTTAPIMMDCYPMSNTWRAARLDAAGAQTIWNQLITILDNALIARPCCDSYARLFQQIEQNVLDSTTRSTITTVMTLLRSDWTNDINFDRRQVDDVGYVDMSGVAWDGTKPAPFFALAPGHVFKHWGAADVRERLVLFDQPTTNTLVGAYYGWKNNPYPRFTFDLAMNNHLIDLAPYQYLSIGLASTDTPRGFAATGLRLIPRAIRRIWNKKSNYFTTQLEVESETPIELSVIGDTPQTVPTVPVLPPPPPPPPPPPVPIPEGNAKELWFEASGSIYWAGDYFAGGQPTWNKITGLPVTPTWFGIARGGSAMYVADAVSLWATTSPKSPTWTQIAGVGTSAAGSTIATYFSYTLGPFVVSNVSVYTFAKLAASSSAWAYGIYNGASWSWTRSTDFLSDTPTGVGKDTYGYASSGNYLREGVTNALLDSYADADNTGYEFYRSPAGTRYVTRHVSGIGYIHQVGGSDLQSLGAATASGDVITTKITGAETGNQVYCVSGNSGAPGHLWLSDNGSSFSDIATWGYGWVKDAAAAGGGSLVWVLASIVSNGVPTRLYNRDGSVLRDMTGNLWSLTSGNLTSHGMGLVY